MSPELGSAINQGAAVVTGLQKKFDWAGIAAAGIGAGIGCAAGKYLDAQSFSVSRSAENIAANTLTNAAGAIANAVTRSAISGGNFGDNIMRALPDVIAQTIGEFMVAELQGPSFERQLDRIYGKDKKLSVVDIQLSHQLHDDIVNVDDVSTEARPLTDYPSPGFSSEKEIRVGYNNSVKKHGYRALTITLSDGSTATFNVSGDKNYIDSVNKHIADLSSNKYGTRMLAGLASSKDLTRIFSTNFSSVTTQRGWGVGWRGSYIAFNNTNAEYPDEYQSSSGKYFSRSALSKYTLAHFLLFPRS